MSKSQSRRPAPHAAPAHTAPAPARQPAQARRPTPAAPRRTAPPNTQRPGPKALHAVPGVTPTVALTRGATPASIEDQQRKLGVRNASLAGAVPGQIIRVEAIRLGYDNDALSRRRIGERFNIRAELFSPKWMVVTGKKATAPVTGNVALAKKNAKMLEDKHTGRDVEDEDEGRADTSDGPAGD